VGCAAGAGSDARIECKDRPRLLPDGLEGAESRLPAGRRRATSCGEGPIRISAASEAICVAGYLPTLPIVGEEGWAVKSIELGPWYTEIPLLGKSSCVRGILHFRVLTLSLLQRLHAPQRVGRCVLYGAGHDVGSKIARVYAGNECGCLHTGEGFRRERAKRAKDTAGRSRGRRECLLCESEGPIAHNLGGDPRLP
jgi:hypothetical protein